MTPKLQQAACDWCHKFFLFSDEHDLNASYHLQVTTDTDNKYERPFQKILSTPSTKPTKQTRWLQVNIPDSFFPGTSCYMYVSSLRYYRILYIIFFVVGCNYNTSIFINNTFPYCDMFVHYNDTSYPQM